MTPESPPPASRRRPRWFFPGLLLVLALSGWATAYFALTRKQEAPPGAVVVFHIAAQPPALLDGVAPAPTEFESYRNAQSVFVRRRLTLNAVLKQPGVANLGVVKAQADPVAWLADNLRVSFGPAEFMRVELDGEPVEELCIVLEAVAKVYLADVDERDNGARRARLQKLEETNRTYCAEVERFRSRLDTIARALGSRDAATLAVMDSFLKDELREAIRGLKAGDEGARARLDEIQKAIGKHGEYRIELENLRSQIGQTEKLQNSLAETIERLRIELGAPPRVTLAEEAAPRRPR